MLRRGAVASLAGIAVALLTLTALAAPNAPLAGQVATLPPTWTPTFTYTPLPTRTPTLTPSITPTVTADEACALFTVLNPGGGQRYYPYDTTFALIFGVEQLSDVTVDFVASHRLSGVGVGSLDMTRTDLNAVNIPIAVLPRPGLYDWSIELRDADDRLLCAYEGIFTAGVPTTPTSTPDVTATPPPQVIIVTATPQVIIVTATPTPEEP
ncbi:MAG: hypothetical protein AAF125_04465 [Chloroflexota bacterium]